MTLDWKSLFSAAGRIDRTTFWTVQLLLAIASACMQATALLFASGGTLAGVVLLLVVSGVVGLFSLVKRLHDLGRSGWWMLLPIGIAMLVVVRGAAKFGRGSDGALASESLALLPWLAFIIWAGVTKGSPGPNRFGEPPAAPVATPGT